MERKKIIKLNGLISFGMLVSIGLLCITDYFFQRNAVIFFYGIIFYICSFFWFFLYSIILQKKLELFAKNICSTIDEMQYNREIYDFIWEEDTIFAHIEHKLVQLYHIMEHHKKEIKKEKKELLSLITDISHQIRTPMTNVKLINETMLRHDITSEQKKECLNTIGIQLDKLNFLITSMIKTSRLETGIIELEKRTNNLMETLTGAVGQVFMKAKEKEIEIRVDCSEKLFAIYDKKWTEEVFFNILDNAVKYTKKQGKIRITVLEQELYVRVDIADNGIGIEEKNQGAVFKRFYREKEVHDIDGIGIGLYLARKIITMQGGYILLRSKKGEGSCFSVYLLMRSI